MVAAVGYSRYAGARVKEVPNGGSLGGVEVGVINTEDAVVLGDRRAVDAGDSHVGVEYGPVLACPAECVVESDVGSSVLVL